MSVPFTLIRFNEIIEITSYSFQQIQQGNKFQILIRLKILDNLLSLLMGNILEKASNNKTAILSGISALAVLGYLLYEAKQKDRFRKQLLNAMANKSNDFQSQMNQVYLHELVDHHNIRNNAQHPIYKIAITGGPCAGKSTSMEKIKNIFTDKGFRVLCVPQVPTMVVLAGGMILMSKFNSQERVKFQSLLIRFQMYAEDYFTKLAEMSNQPAIVLCDRGTVDPYAYIPKEEFQAVLDAQGWSWVTLRDRRYDRVCFMSSAANGAQEFYSLENNVARSEGVELARELDRKTLQAWTGHPHLTVVPNVKGESFNDKIDRAIVAVSKTVGQQIFDLIYHKYLIQQPKFPEEIKPYTSQIEETFLVNDDPSYEEDKLKKRGANNSFTYQRKYKFVKADSDYSQQIRKPLTSLQFVTIKEERADPNFNIVARKRINFVYNNLSYAIDVYDNILGQDKVYLLRFSSKKGQAEENIPKFLNVVKDVLGQKQYSLRQIARKKE